MPFFDRNDNPIAPEQAGQSVPWGVGDGDASGDTPSYGETLRANFRLNNVIDSALESHRTGTLTTPVDPSFNPWNEIKGTPYEDYWKRFVDVRNRTDFELLKQDIDAENIARGTLSRSGTLATLSTGLLAGIADPTVLIPGGAAVRGPRLGYDALKTALVTGASAAAIAGTQEAILHATQQTRGLDESAYNVLGATVVGSLLGGVIAKSMTRAEISAITRNFAADLASGPAANEDADAVEQIIKSVRNFGMAEPGAVKSSPVLKAGAQRAAEDALRSQIVEIDQKIAALPEADPQAVEALARLETVETNLKDPNLTPAERKTLQERRDELLTNTNPEKLRAAAKPAEDRRTLEAQKAQVADQIGRLNRESAEREVERMIRAEKLSRSLKERGFNPDALPNLETMPAQTLVEEAVPAPKVPEAAPETPTQTPTPKSGGSAATPVPHLDELQIDGKIAKAAARMAPFSPIMRAMQWASPKARSLMFRLAENSVYLNGANEGKTTGPAVENLVHQWTRGVMGQALDLHSQAYGDAVKAGWQGTRRDFNEAVAASLRRGDRSANPNVAQAARMWREQIITTLTERAKKVGLLPEDIQPTTAESYFTRVWNRKQLKAEEFETADKQPGFKPTAENYFRLMIDPKQFDSQAEYESYIKDITDNVFDQLTGRGANFGFDFQKVAVAERGPLKERTFNIPDELVERWLDNDVERVMHRFTRIMSADVELAERFPDSIDQGTKRVTLNGPLKDVQEEYKRLRETVQARADLDEGGKAKLLAKLNKEETGAIRDIQAVRDLLRGTYGQNLDHATWARVSRVAATFQYIVKMGDVVKSSLTDIARPMMVHGLRNYFSAVGNLAADPAFRRIAKAEARRAGAIGDRALQARLATWADIVDPYLSETPFERFVANSGRVLSRASGISLWNDWMKTVASAATESRLVKNLMTDPAKLSAKERRYMAYVGIDGNMAERMRGQIGANPKDSDGFWHSGTDDWADNEARRTFWAAIDKDVNSQIVTPGVADVPLFQHSDLGRLLLQFKSFVIASHQKAFIRALQEGGNGQAAGVLAGITASVAIGMFISWLTAIETNRVDQMSKNPGTWLAEGIDRSGMLPLFMEANNTFERAVPGYGFYGALEAPFDEPGSGGASRFGVRPLSSLLTGPTGGTLDDMQRTFSDPRRALTLLPGRTLPYIRPLLEWGVRPELDSSE